MDLTLAPADARARVEAVIGVVEQASGYDLVYQGDTTLLSAEFRSSVDYGMLIRWSTPAQEPGLSGSAIGLGGPSATGAWNGSGWDYWIRTGVVQIDAGFTSFQEGWGNPNSLEEVLAHEIAHAMNLNHVDFRSELMYPSAIGVGGLGEGTTYALDRAQDLTCRNDSAFTAAGADGGAAPTYTIDVPVTLGGGDLTHIVTEGRTGHVHGTFTGVEAMAEPRLYGALAPEFGGSETADGDPGDASDDSGDPPHGGGCGCCACAPLS
ncbi:MAG: hypothetical protein AAFZ07_20860 [Actinomycetota bacterium]